MQPRRQPTINYIFIAVAVLLVLQVFITWAKSVSPAVTEWGITGGLILGILIGGYYFKWEWTGFTDYAYPKLDGVEFHRRKTLWDWLQLLIIPSVLAGAALLFNAQSTQTQLDITTDDQREAALQAYIDKMSELLLDRKLRTSEEGTEIRSVARTRTLSTLRQLDSTRKGQVLQFLQESGLISRTDTIIVLSGANLRNLTLEAANFEGPSFQETDLQGANLSWANLQGANLSWANLEDANLRQIELRGANLQGANLREAGVQVADLQGANLADASFIEADLERANFQEANLRGSNFGGANLQEANFQGADLQGVNLADANIRGANFQGANLIGAFITPEQYAITDFNSVTP
jgi:uncharacterized protein YjbI with pentapeptide repeats